MPIFSKSSLRKLETCDERLLLVCNKAIKIYDFSVLCGYRGKEDQEAAFINGKSKLHYPQSKHNRLPSLAVDIAPFPIVWDNRERFVMLAGIMLGIASSENISLRWGGDWNRNMDLDDESFNDLLHFELY